MPTEFLIPRDLLEGVVRYLQTRPYAEVFQAVPALQSLKPAPVVEVEAPPLAGEDLHG